jgi:hypothetical protein
VAVAAAAGVDILNYSGVDDTNWEEVCATFHLCMEESMHCIDIDVVVSYLNQMAEADTCMAHDLQSCSFYLFSFCLLPCFEFAVETQEFSLYHPQYGSYRMFYYWCCVLK